MFQCRRLTRPKVDAEERYEKSLKRSLNAYRQKTSRQKYAQNETYAQYRQEVWVCISGADAYDRLLTIFSLV